MPTRITALGFIFVTLGGNVWLIYTLVGDPAPTWLVALFNGGILLAILGGIGMVFWHFKNGSSQIDDEVDEAPGDEAN